MSIFNKIQFPALRNDAHGQIHADIIDLIRKHDAAALNVADQFAAYAGKFAPVDEANKAIVKSALTGKIQDADRDRDETFSGMADLVNTHAKHFDPATREAAERLKILFNTYGNIAKKTIVEQTTATVNLLQDIGGKYAADARKIGLDAWAAELERRNDALTALRKERNDEAAAKTDVVLRKARTELDAAYRAIIKRIDALVTLNGIAGYETFSKAHNVIIDTYARLLARGRSGRQGNREQGTENGDTDVEGSNDE